MPAGSLRIIFQSAPVAPRSVWFSGDSGPAYTAKLEISDAAAVIGLKKSAGEAKDLAGIAKTNAQTAITNAGTAIHDAKAAQDALTPLATQEATLRQDVTTDSRLLAQSQRWSQASRRLWSQFSRKGGTLGQQVTKSLRFAGIGVSDNGATLLNGSYTSCLRRLEAVLKIG